MTVVIGEIISEVVLAPSAAGAAGPTPSAGGTDTSDAFVELVVRRAAERVLEALRQEWER